MLSEKSISFYVSFQKILKKKNINENDFFMFCYHMKNIKIKIKYN